MNICLIFFWSGIMFIEVSKNLIDLSKFFPENLYVVGGYVRNKLLKISSGDVDLASSVDIEEVSKRLEGSEFSVKVKNIRTGQPPASVPSHKFQLYCHSNGVPNISVSPKNCKTIPPPHALSYSA